MPRDKYDEFDALEDVDEEELDEEELDEEGLAAKDPEDWDDDAVDEDVQDLFNEAQQLDYGHRDTVNKMRQHTASRPEVFGGDVDANLNYADVGEETIGGENPTPDQDSVDEIGEGVGLTYEDDEPLNTEEKLEAREQNPWELNPASLDLPAPSRQVSERQLEPAHAPTGGERSTARTRQGQKSAAGPKRRAGQAKSRSGTGGRRGENKRRGTARGSQRTRQSRSQSTGRSKEQRRKSDRTRSGRVAAKRK